MGFPTASEYQAALQNPAIAFPDVPELAQAQVETNNIGIPRPYSGNFTATFKLQGDGQWALRCYTREVRDVADRYQSITHFLESRPDPALTMAKFIPAGILVGSARFEIIQMDWVAGVRLDDFVAATLKNDHSRLDSLASSFLELGARLEHLGIAHGDIQHGNVIVDPSGTLRLVDYDDMFLPELRHLRFSSGLGQENYQHPGRVSTHFDENLDRFSIMSIYITLRALTQKPDLWTKYDGGDDNLLFRKADFLDPYTSPLFRDMDAITPIKEFIDRFASICNGTYDEIPSVSDFLDGRFPYSRYAPKSAKMHSISGELPPRSSPIFHPRQMGTPPSIGSEAPTLIDTAAARDTPQSTDIPVAIPPISPRVRNLPPSGGGIAPSNFGISPLIGTSHAFASTHGAQDSSKRASLYRVLGIVATAVVLIGLFLGSWASRATHPTTTQPPEAVRVEPQVPVHMPKSRPFAETKHLPVPADKGTIDTQTSPPSRVPLIVTPANVPAHSKAPVSSQSRPLQQSDAVKSEPNPRREAGRADTATVPRVGPQSSLDTAPAESSTRGESGAPATTVPRVAPQRSIDTATPCSTPDGPAHLIAKVAPDLSPQTLTEAAGKSVVVSVDVAADGSVRNTSIITASGVTRLDLAALSVAARSTYAPTETNCVATPGTVTLTVNY